MAEPASVPLPPLQLPPPAQLPPTGSLTLPPTQPTQPAQPANIHPTTRLGKLWRRVKVFLGYAGPDRSAQGERRDLVRYLATLLSSLAQVRGGLW